MSLLVSNLATNITNKIGLSSSEGSLVLTWLTQGYRDLISKIPLFYIQTTTIAITTAADDYQLAATVGAIEEVTVLTSTVKPTRVSREEIQDLRRYANSGASTGDLYAYCIEGNLLSVYPYPTSSYSISITYTAEATVSDFAGTENLVTDLKMLPLGPLAKALEYYGLWQAAEYDDKGFSQRASDYMNQYEQFAREARKVVRQRASRHLLGKEAGYPSRRGFPQRNDVYPSRHG